MNINVGISMRDGRKSVQLTAENYRKLCHLKEVLHYRSIDNVVTFVLIEREFRMKKPED